MMVKVLLCGEGPTDYGSPQFGTQTWLEGAIQPIIRKVVDVEFEHVTKEKLKGVKLQRSSIEAKVKGHGIKSLKLSKIASEEKIRNIICYVDSDKEPSSTKSETEAEKRFLSIYNEISEGFKAYNSNSSFEIQGIPMVPVRMIESWLLGDENAYEKCFGRIPLNPKIPKNPELLWGDDKDPKSEFPKCYLNRILEQYYKESSRETFNYIAENVDIETLKKKCPISFKKFIEDIENWSL